MSSTNKILLHPAAASDGRESPRNPQLLTRPECASAIRISVRKLDDLTKRRILPCYRVGGKILYRLDRVMDALDRLEQQEGNRV